MNATLIILGDAVEVVEVAVVTVAQYHDPTVAAVALSLSAC